MTILGWLYDALVVVGIGAVLAFLYGFRAKQIDNHPICRRCGYDLFGLGKDHRLCPECGAVLQLARAIRIGHRTRHKPLMLIAACIAALVFAAAWWCDLARDEIRSRPARFIQAVQTDDVEAAVALMELHPQFANGDYFGVIPVMDRPIHLAIVSAGSDELLAHLLKAGADPNAVGEYGKPALLVAVERYRMTAVRMLLEMGADPSMADEDGRTPLWETIASHPDTTIMTLLLGAGASVQETDERGDTLLHRIVRIHYSDRARVLIEAGVDPNAANRHGRTPLHVACERSNIEAGKVLIDHGARMWQRDKAGRSPGMPSPYAESSWRYSHWRAADLWWYQLKNASKAGNLAELADPLRSIMDAPSMQGGGPLRFQLQRAVDWRYPDIVRFLLDCGVEPTQAAHPPTSTALHLIGNNPGEDSLQIMDLLIAAGADVNHPDRIGQTPLHIAALRSVKTVRKLIDAGADIALTNHRGQTPLAWAREFGGSSNDAQAAIELLEQAQRAAGP